MTEQAEHPHAHPEPPPDRGEGLCTNYLHGIGGQVFWCGLPHGHAGQHSEVTGEFPAMWVVVNGVVSANEAATGEAMVPLSLLSRALDEIFALRSLCAYEAGVRKSDLGLKSYPKSRRVVAETRIKRLTEAAQGRWREAMDPRRSKYALRSVGAPETLVRAAWEAEES